MKRGLLTVESLKARCVIDAATHCWIWQGAKSSQGYPKMHTFDHERGEKRAMNGSKAAWNIAHQSAPPSYAPLVYRCCGQKLCLNPAHLRCAKDKAEIGLHIRRSGQFVGTGVEARRKNQLLAMEARGIKPTPADVVLAIRSAPKIVTGLELAALHGISTTAVSRIRRGQSHRGVV